MLKKIINVLNSEGKSLLNIACRFGSNDIINMIIDCPGINVNIQNTDGSTPALGCCWQRNNLTEIRSILKLLKERDADISIPNNIGETCKMLLNKKAIDLVNNYLENNI